MAKALIENTCSDFAQELAAKTSVPGGGGAAAFVGALSAALGSMVANFTTGKPKYAQYEEDIQRILADGEQLRVRLLNLVELDAQNFYPLSQAYALPKEDPAREATLERCLKEALSAPRDMMHAICNVIELLEELNTKGSRLLLSDVGCGASLAKAALESAAINVFVNTASLQDKGYANDVNNECNSMLTEYGTRAQALADTVMAQFQK